MAVTDFMSSYKDEELLAKCNIFHLYRPVSSSNILLIVDWFFSYCSFVIGPSDLIPDIDHNRLSEITTNRLNTFEL